MKLSGFALTALLVAAAAVSAGAQKNPFVGTWNITGEAPNENYVYWLQVSEEGGKLSGMFLNRGGHAQPVQELKVSKGELSFVLPGRGDNRPAATFRVSGDKLTGTVGGAQPVKVTGVRTPDWGPCNANAQHTFGKPVALFEGKSLDAWTVHNKSKPMGWRVEDGVMINEPKANNLISKQEFKDFRLDAEYRVSPKGNSGIYLRGRYELQVLDDAGQEPFDRGHLSVYGRVKPAVNASKPAGEWQTLQATLVGNCLTAVLNGKTVHDNVRIPAITGGALNAKETEAGPIMIQGDHEVVAFRKIVVTPITASGKGTK